MTSQQIHGSEQVRRSRSVERLVAGRPTSDGAGVKLTRVLTHEIMNSVAPISSLASTAAGLLEGIPAHEGPEEDAETMSDVRGAIGTIARRSEGLLRFVNEYRRLTRVPPPTLELVPVSELFKVATELYREEAARGGVVMTTSIEPKELELTADRDQIEQVLINLTKNALQAVDGVANPQIHLSAFIDSRSRAVIEVTDNGTGIVEEAMDKLFVPFFTTKKDGSGIGLSLAREVMRRHGGSIAASSQPGEQTVFRLRF